jgi:hypothetical protein
MTEDPLGRLVTDNLTPVALRILEQVSGRKNGRVGVVDRLNVRAIERGIDNLVSQRFKKQEMTIPRLTKCDTCEYP